MGTTGKGVREGVASSEVGVGVPEPEVCQLEVGNRDGFRHRAESQDRQDRTEDLFTRYFHGRFDTANDGRGHELPGRARQTMAAEYDLCAS